MYLSHFAEILASVVLFKQNCFREGEKKTKSLNSIGFHLIEYQTSLTKLVANVAALTSALELERPAAGGIFPETITNIPYNGPFGNSS